MSSSVFVSGSIRRWVLSAALVLGTASAVYAAEIPKTVNLASGGDVDDVRMALTDKGFTDVGAIEHRGNVYVTKAKWEGRWIDLSIDERNGGIRYVTGGDLSVGDAQAMSDEQLRDALGRLGYSGVGAIEREGNVFSTTAMRDGRQTVLRIDARTGAVRDASASHGSTIQEPREHMDAAALEEQLKPLGYSQVRDVEEEGNIYSLDAMKDGRWVELRIDARTGAVDMLR